MKITAISFNKIPERKNTNFGIKNPKDISFQGNLPKILMENIVPKQKRLLPELKKTMKYIIKIIKNKTCKNSNIPIASKPLIAPALQSPSEFCKKTAEKALKNAAYGSSVDSQYSANYQILNEIKSKGISIPDAPWDAPIADSGFLTNSAFDKVADKIKDSNLDQYKKDELISKLKRINFKGNGENTIDLVDIKDFDAVNDIPIETDITSVSDLLEVLHDHIKDFGEHFLDFLKDVIDPT